MTDYWIPAEPYKTEIPSPSIVPLKSLTSNDAPFSFQLFIEKTKC